MLDYSLPVGASLQETDAACRRIEAILLDTPEVASLSRRTGAELGFFATEQFTGDMLVGLEPRAASARAACSQVIDALRERLAREVPQAEVEFIQVMQDTIADLAGQPGADRGRAVRRRLPGAAASWPTAPRRAIERIPGVVDVKNHVSLRQPGAALAAADPLGAARLGLSTETIAAQDRRAAARRSSPRASRQRDRFVDVRVRYPAALARRPRRRTAAGRACSCAHRRRAPDASAACRCRASRRFERRPGGERAGAREPGADGARDGGVVGPRPGLGGRAVERAVRALPHDPASARRVRRAGAEPAHRLREPAARVRARRAGSCSCCW